MSDKLAHCRPSWFEGTDEERALEDSFSVSECSVKLRHSAFGFEISEQRKVELAIA